ncbi:MAG TPA: hypothetical protein VEA99_14290, partial [Gemmatimonadaceae bacterium]|nr:hypothetical protein [Gemmatimonadaceae bacterium]
LVRDSTLLDWTRAAKDGAEIARAARVREGATFQIGIGETHDMEITPDRAGEMRLEVRQGAASGPFTGRMLARWVLDVR